MNFNLQRDKLLKNDIYHAWMRVISIFVQLMSLTYSQNEKLKSKKLIEQLFVEGKAVTEFPLRLVYMPTALKEGQRIKTGVSVGKQHFKKAVDRNRIKRLIREAYRLNKPLFFNNITTQYALMILYIGKEIPTFKEVNFTMEELLKKFVKEASK